jgi:hypothetical protein
VIGLYTDAGARLAVTMPNGLVLNNPSDEPNDTFELNAVITAAQFDTSIDSDPTDDGAIVSPAKRVLYVVRLDGTVRAPTLAKLYDKKQLLAASFDPSLASRTYPSTDGFSAMTFSVPTTDTTEYATGLVSSIYYVRSRKEVVPIDSMYQGTAAFFSAELLLRDPRRYYGTADTLGSVASGTADNEGDAPTWPILTLTMAGPGNVAFTMERVAPLNGTKQLVLDLTGLSASDSVVVTFERGRITVNGSDAPERYVSGDFFDLDPGENTITYTNFGNATRSLSWRRAWTI